MIFTIHVHVFVMILILAPCLQALGEPACSKFHFEEKVLEKMVRLEFAVEKFAQRLDGMEAQMKEASTKNKREMERFSDRQTSALSQLNEVGANLTKQMVAMKDKMRLPLIWFRARGPANMKPSTGQTIVYTNDELNHGTGYSVSTGIFTAPRSGLYLFILHICTKAGDPMRLSIIQDNVQVVGAGISVGNSYDCSTLTAHVIMDSGSRVWIKCTNPGTLGDMAGHYWNSFAGLLIQTM